MSTWVINIITFCSLLNYAINNILCHLHCIYYVWPVVNWLLRKQSLLWGVSVQLSSLLSCTTLLVVSCDLIMLLKSTWNLSFCFLFGVQKCPEVMSCSVLVYWHKLICFHNMRWSQFHYKLNQVLGYLFVFNPTVFKLVILLCSSFLFCCIIFVNCLFDNQETVANNLQKTVCNDVILNDWNKITNIKINEGEGGSVPTSSM